jgi:predicted RNase H-like nuclease
MANDLRETDLRETDLSETALAGLDGCRAGFLAAVAPDGRLDSARFEPVGDLPAFLARPFAVIAVDMPIGLPDRVGAGGRGPEAALRPRLGARQSSVFAIPARAAVEAGDYGAACRIAAATSDPPRKVSKQAFALFPKILALDAALRGDPAAAARTFEVHPEGAFAAMAGRPLDAPKKIRGTPNPAGLAERRALLEAQGFAPALLASPPPPGAQADDALDALACLWTARRLRDGEAIRHGDGRRDSHGLAIAIWS